MVVVGFGGGGLILFWKQLGLQVKTPVLFILSNKANCFSAPLVPFGGWGKKSLQLSELAQLLERVRPSPSPTAFRELSFSCRESKTIIKALIYLYIFSIDIIDPPIAAS